MKVNVAGFRRGTRRVVSQGQLPARQGDRTGRGRSAPRSTPATMSWRTKETTSAPGLGSTLHICTGTGRALHISLRYTDSDSLTLRTKPPASCASTHTAHSGNAACRKLTAVKPHAAWWVLHAASFWFMSSVVGRQRSVAACTARHAQRTPGSRSARNRCTAPEHARCVLTARCIVHCAEALYLVYVERKVAAIVAGFASCTSRLSHGVCRNGVCCRLSVACCLSHVACRMLFVACCVLQHTGSTWPAANGAMATSVLPATVMLALMMFTPSAGCTVQQFDGTITPR